MFRRSRDHSIESEPHIQGGPYRADPGDRLDDAHDAQPGKGDAFQPNAAGARPVSIDETVGQSVWDEPALNTSLSGPLPPGALTYGRWLRDRASHWSTSDGWMAAICVGLISGPISILFSFLGGLQFGYGLAFFMTSIGIPLMQELLKVILLVWMVERRPFMFSNRAQIVFGSTLSALCLVLFYLPYAFFTYEFNDPVQRGLYFVAYPIMQIVCSLFVGVGLAVVWKNAIRAEKPPSLSDGATLFMTGVGIHVFFASACVVWERFLAPIV